MTYHNQPKTTLWQKIKSLAEKMNPVYWIKPFIRRILNLLQYMAADGLVKISDPGILLGFDLF